MSRAHSITNHGHACGPTSRDTTGNASFPLSSCERLAAWKASQWLSLAPLGKQYEAVFEDSAVQLIT
jgi:hypothetical protein